MSLIGEERNPHYKKESKKFCEFLKLVKQWHRTKNDDGKTGQEILQTAWNNIRKN